MQIIRAIKQLKNNIYYLFKRSKLKKEIAQFCQLYVPASKIDAIKLEYIEVENVDNINLEDFKLKQEIKFYEPKN